MEKSISGISEFSFRMNKSAHHGVFDASYNLH